MADPRSDAEDDMRVGLDGEPPLDTRRSVGVVAIVIVIVLVVLMVVLHLAGVVGPGVHS